MEHAGWWRTRHSINLIEPKNSYDPKAPHTYTHDNNESSTLLSEELIHVDMERAGAEAGEC